MKKNNIMITGRRWFDKVYGNTYHSARAYYNGECIGEVQFTYGYGNQYEVTGWDILTKAGIVKPGKNEAMWKYCQDHNITLTTEVTDVQRKKDL